jgi:hypothetical protein
VADVWVVMLVAVLVRVAYWISKWDAALLFNDSVYYSGQAVKLFHGEWFRDPFFDMPGAEHGPLTSLLMAPLSGGSDPHRWQRLVTVVCGIVLVWLVMKWVSEMTSTRAGLIAGGLAAVHPNLWMNDGLVMAESVALVLMVAGLWTAWRRSGGVGRFGWWAPGVLLGLASLARSEMLLVAVIVAGWWLWRERGSGCWRLLVAAVVVVTPWTAWNATRFDAPVLLTTNEGGVMLGANCDATYSGRDIGGWSILCLAADPEYRPDEDAAVRSSRQRSIAASYVRTHLSSVPEVMAARVLRTFDLYGFESQMHQDVGEERPRWAVWAGIAVFWVLVPLSVLGWRRLGRDAHPFVLAPVVVSVVTALVFYAGHRLRVTGEPSMAVLSAVGVAHVLASRVARRGADT